MEELINLVVQKTGISHENAKSAVETVLNFVKGKLPEAVSGQIDAAVSGESGGLGDLAKSLGGMFGKSS